MSSVILRGELQIARQQECDAITGAREASRTSLKSFVGHVGNIDEHAEPVHFTNHFPAKFGEAVVPREWFDESAQSVGGVVRERHVTHAAREEVAQNIEIVVDGVTAFDAHQDGDFPLHAGGADFAGTGGKHQVIRVAANLLVHGIQQIEREASGL